MGELQLQPRDQVQEIGYFAVVAPELVYYQGFFLMAGEALDDAARLTIEAAGTAVQTFSAKNRKSKPDARGALRGALFDVVLREDKDKIAVLARAISILEETDWFTVVGRKEAEGTLTDLTYLKARNVGDAQREVEGLPDVARVRASLAETLMTGTPPVGGTA